MDRELRIYFENEQGKIHVGYETKLLCRHKIPTPYAGNGFEEQISHFSQCIIDGLTESPVLTRENTLYIARQMDGIRKMTGIAYPQDK